MVQNTEEILSSNPLLGNLTVACFKAIFDKNCIFSILLFLFILFQTCIFYARQVFLKNLECECIIFPLQVLFNSYGCQEV